MDPDLVMYNAQGQPETLRFDSINAMLLNEFLKEHRKVQQLEVTVAQQQKNFEQQQARIEALTANLQASHCPGPNEHNCGTSDSEQSIASHFGSTWLTSDGSMHREDRYQPFDPADFLAAVLRNQRVTYSIGTAAVTSKGLPTVFVRPCMRDAMLPGSQSQ